MEAEDYKTLLKQAEEELGSTPGAYCSRKAALRAMELLREAGQKEFEEAQKKARTDVAIARANASTLQQTIEKQAQAIQELQSNKQVRLGSGIDPKPSVVWEETKEGYMKPRYIAGVDPIDGGNVSVFDRRLLEERARQLEEQRKAERDRYESPFKKRLDEYFDKAKLWE